MTPSIVLVGCGNMGGAMLAGWLRSGIAPETIAVVDSAATEMPDGVRHYREDIGLSPPGTLVVAVKPQKLGEVAPLLGRLAGPATIVLSVLAAVEFAPLRRVMPEARTIVRAVPNLPSSIGRGVTALVADREDADGRAVIGGMVASLGPVEWLEAEWQCDPVTAVSGCGPAFLFRFADASMQAGAALGLDRALVRRLVIQTLLGSAELLAASDGDPATLAARVASPGGVTLAGLAQLDEKDAMKALMARTLAAANARSIEMAENFR